MGGEGRGSLPVKAQKKQTKNISILQKCSQVCGVVNLGKSAGGKNRCPVGQK